MDRRLLGGLTPAAFLKKHWQKKPLLVRGAFPAFQDPVTPDELGGLALEPGVESRLVFEKGGKRPWELRQGPFKDSALRRLPKSHWTLLVQVSTASCRPPPPSSTASASSPAGAATT